MGQHGGTLVIRCGHHELGVALDLPHVDPQSRVRVETDGAAGLAQQLTSLRALAVGVEDVQQMAQRDSEVLPRTSFVAFGPEGGGDLVPRGMSHERQVEAEFADAGRAARRDGRRLGGRAVPCRCRRGSRSSTPGSRRTIVPADRDGGATRRGVLRRAPADPRRRRRMPDRIRATLGLVSWVRRPVTELGAGPAARGTTGLVGRASPPTRGGIGLRRDPRCGARLRPPLSMPHSQPTGADPRHGSARGGRSSPRPGPWQRADRPARPWRAGAAPAVRRARHGRPRVQRPRARRGDPQPASAPWTANHERWPRSLPSPRPSPPRDRRPPPRTSRQGGG